MEGYFSHSQIFESDCYVADYTNATSSQKGVVISENPFDDIAYFHLHEVREGQIRYLAVNLEQYPAFIDGIDNCECIFSALSEYRKPWLLLLETKYCKPDNIEGHTYKAFTQMFETFGKLVNEGLVENSGRNVYFTFSVPEHTDLRPFGSFTLSQNETLKAIKERGIHLLGENSLLIATASHLLIPKSKIS